METAENAGKRSLILFSSYFLCLPYFTSKLRLLKDDMNAFFSCYKVLIYLDSNLKRGSVLIKKNQGILDDIQ